ncbi:hypothetical protein BH09PAT3_BH09PAT3_5740 [soil metagenome]
MTATNHVVTGCLVAAVITNPLIALPLAVILHFVLDALPHYGERGNAGKALGRLKYILPVDALAGLSVMAIVYFQHPEHVFTIIAGGILCASPDLLQIPRYIRYLTTKNAEPYNDPISRFHHYIQWGERPWGYLVEAPWFGSMFYLLLARI